MGWMEEYLAKGANGTPAQTGPTEPTVLAHQGGELGGFLESAVSGIGEMFGQSPTEGAKEYRNYAPWQGFASQLVGTAVPYLGAFRASQTVRGAALLEGALAKTGIDMAKRPILGGMVKETLRYAPLELGRLGVGLVTAPDENVGDLFADVAMSTAFTGAFGALGGFFRMAGKEAPISGSVLGADLRLKPTFELRLGRAEGAQVSGEVPIAQVLDDLTRDVLTEQPLRGGSNPMGKFMQGVDEATQFGNNSLNGLFRPSVKDAPGLSKRMLIEGADDDFRTLAMGEQESVVRALGMDDIKDVAETFVYPRVIDVKSSRGAGTLNHVMAEGRGMEEFAPGVFMAREKDTGLFVVMKKLASDENVAAAAAKKAPSRRSVGVAAEGDRWFVAKTDQPNKLVPELHSVQERVIADWAKWREPFQPGGADDIISRSMQINENTLTSLDAAEMSKVGKQTWIANQSKRLTQRMAQITGLENSTVAKQMAEGLWDIAAPTLSKVKGNSLYGRFEMQLRTAVQTGDTAVMEMVRGRTLMGSNSPMGMLKGKHVQAETWATGGEELQTFHKLVHSLTPEEVQLVDAIGKARLPAERLSELTVDGLANQKVIDVVKAMEANDKAFLEKMFLPAMKAAGRMDEFKPLEGYIGIPRTFKGDYQVKVLNEKGQQQWLSVGTLGGAKAEAQAMVDEAAKRGLRWTAEKPIHAVDVGPKEFEALHSRIGQALHGNEDAQDIVVKVQRQLMAARGQRRAGGLGGTRGQPGSFNERTGAAGTPDLDVVTADDMLTSIQSHYQTLMKYASVHTWSNKYGPVMATQLKGDSPKLYADLMRKAEQHLGIEGALTKAQNAALAPLLGSSLGGKPASRIASATNATMYAWNLGIVNPTFALLNLLSPISQVMPWVSMMATASPERVAKYMMHVPMYGSDGLVRQAVGTLHPMKVLGQAMKSLKNPDAELRQLYDEALTDGTLRAQHYDGFVGVNSEGSQTLREAWEQDGMAKFLWKGATWMSDKSETFSRMVAFNSAYHVGKDMFALQGDQLYRFVQQGVRSTMYGYQLMDRSRIFTGPIGSMFGLFKNWQAHYIANMIEYMGEGVKHGNWGPFAWMMGSAAAVGGLGATPLTKVADGFARWAGESPDSYAYMRENWGDTIGDGVQYGLPGLIGVSLQSSATTPGTDVMHDVTGMMNIVFMERLKQVGKAVGESWGYARATGENPLANDNIRDQLAGALLPRAFFRAMSTTEGDYVRSMQSGYPTVRGLSPMDKLLHGAGLNVVAVDAQQDQGQRLFKATEAKRAKIQNYGKAMLEAQQEQDWQKMTDLMHTAAAEGLDVSSIMKSMNTRGKREGGDSLDRYKGQEAQAARQVLQGWESSSGE